MHVCFCILGTNKNIDRLKLLTEGAIKSRSGNHKITMNFVAEGSRPGFLPKEWNWIPADNIYVGDRHVYALKSGIANSSYDYVFFCDDDVMIDVDLFVSIAEKQKNVPHMWSSFPGHWCSEREKRLINKYAKQYIKNRDLNSLYMGWCTSVVNKKFIEKVEHDPVLDVLMSISNDLCQYGKHFIPDIQISILSWMMNFGHTSGESIGATQWPCILQSSLLNSHGKLWHVHDTLKSPLLTRDNLSNVLKKGPYNNVEKLITSLYPNISKGFKARDFTNKKINIGWFWRPWRRFCYPVEIKEPMFLKNIVLKNDGSILHENGGNAKGFTKWKPCKNGLMLFGETPWNLKFTMKCELGNIGYTKNADPKDIRVNWGEESAIWLMIES